MKPFTLNLKGNIVCYERPLVMAIVNVTPDSFYEGSRTFDHGAIKRRVEQIIADGADMIDIGAYSSRPGANNVSVDEEIDRLARGMNAIRQTGCSLPVSVDTFRAKVAEVAVTQMGCDIINDISGTTLDDDMADTVARLHVPYILMHMRGTPDTMQSLTDYDDVTVDVVRFLAEKLAMLDAKGVGDIIIDPGFGFAKTLQQNYRLMSRLPEMLRLLQRPMLVGISRKSMLTRLLGITSDNALQATTALNAYALDRGAAILRVHDVSAARQAIEIYQAVSSPNTVEQ